MRGLLEKDYCLMVSNWRMLLMFWAISVFIGFTQEGSFILGYFPFAVAALLVGTISYDEMDQGFRFLMTLPVDAKVYIREKYMLCLIGTVAAWLISVVIYVAAEIYREGSGHIIDEIPMLLVFLPVMLLVLSVMIPIQVKFGSERGRAMLAGVIGGIGAVVVIFSKTVMGKQSLSGMLAVINKVDAGILVAAVYAVVVVICVISYRISRVIMERKEF